eukprot:CAMPEP_0113685644 /NCGR_PEP_ID=MMETSP0038_2-20120614/14799_1 /TAXON_ID=2898 /ORGANISM="Cryptomonas paramecium" /LENGTH=75 /DNA_ID=CAMNT_0000605779 /DNA_START=49 /DNA_END=271 /DNA_ORIENTATION=- /assembly_acc=CAM_ASM_000170
MRTTSTTLSKIERLERILEEEREKRLVAEREIQLLKDAILQQMKAHLATAHTPNRRLPLAANLGAASPGGGGGGG